MDNRPLYDRLQAFDGTQGAPNDFATLSASRVGAYNCPDDLSFGTPGSITYVANAGFVRLEQWTGADTAIALADVSIDAIDWNDSGFNNGVPVGPMTGDLESPNNDQIAPIAVSIHRQQHGDSLGSTKYDLQHV